MTRLIWTARLFVLLCLFGSSYVLLMPLFRGFNATGVVTTREGSLLRIEGRFEGQPLDCYPSGVQRWGLEVGDRVTLHCRAKLGPNGGPLCSPETTRTGVLVLSGMVVGSLVLSLLMLAPVVARLRRRSSSP